MFKNNINKVILTIFLTCVSIYSYAQLEPVLDTNKERAQLAQASQIKIDSFQDKTDKDSSEYKSVSKQIEGLKVYNAQKRKQIKRQVARMKEIEKTMKDSTILQRQIPPLARRMFEGLKQFVALDIPFRSGERTERLSFIQTALDNPVVSPAEKLRQVLDGYAVEGEYGRKIDTYKETILIEGQERDVNILRIGRLVLAYQTSDLSETGMWNKTTQSWESLPGRYRNTIRDGIAMAKKIKTVDILELPISAAEVAQ
tara:strand:+ start:11865 stop:12632 length:768 start_codon:yes stop_codon:yes gene_type:complete